MMDAACMAPEPAKQAAALEVSRHRMRPASASRSAAARRTATSTDDPVQVLVAISRSRPNGRSPNRRQAAFPPTRVTAGVHRTDADDTLSVAPRTALLHGSPKQKSRIALRWRGGSRKFIGGGDARRG